MSNHRALVVEDERGMALEIGDLLGLEPPFGRHSRSPRFVANRLQNQARRGLARNHRGAALTPFEEAIAVIDPEPPGRLVVSRVAVEALPRQQGPNPPLEELELRRIDRFLPLGHLRSEHGQR